MSQAESTASSSESSRIRALTGPDVEAGMRLVRLEAGQKVLATVLSAEAGGQLTIGMFGARIPAVTHLQLDVGKTYEFKVAATDPQLVLSAALPLKVPGSAAALESGLLGAPAKELGAMLLQFSSLSEPELPAQDRVLRKITQQMQAFSAGQASADELRGLVDSLGHDQEQRVLRMPRLVEKRAQLEVRSLQETLKAVLLDMVSAESRLGRGQASKELATALLADLSRVEVDNARRSEQGGPIHLPLPLAPGSHVLDARLFAFPPPESEKEGESPAGSANREWTIVLLLDLSRLGALRVDLRVGGETLSAEFQLVEFEPSLKLRAGIEELREELQQAGLQVRELVVRHAAGAGLAVADLLLPPETWSDPATRVDLHV